MNKLILLVVFKLNFFCLLAQTGITSKNNFSFKPHNIVVKIRLSTPISSDSLKLEFLPLNTLGAQWVSINKKPVNNEVTWSINSEKPILVYLEKSLNKQKKFLTLEPGDNIGAEYDGNKYKLSGVGSDKLRLQQEIDSAYETIRKPQNTNQWITKSLQDFLDLHDYSVRALNLSLPLIDSYKNKLSDYAYNTIRVNTILRIQENKLDKFSGLARNAVRFGISKIDLCSIFDSCFYNAPWSWVLANDEYGTGWYAFIRWQMKRKSGFEYVNDSIRTESKRKFLYYEEGKRTYSGLALQRFLYDLIANHTIHEIGFTPEVESLLNVYYTDPEVLPEYKQYVKAYELKNRQLVSGKLAPEFSIIDTNGKLFTKDDFKGKIVLLDFWFTGCTGCVQMNPALKKVGEHFKADSNIVFLSISIDKDKVQWTNSIKQGKYTMGDGIHLYTGGLGNEHPVMTAYSISGYPTLHLIDAFGLIVQNPLPDPRHDDGKKLIELIETQSSLMKDGPYITYKSDTATAHYINFSSVSRYQFYKKASPALRIQADKKNDSFFVKLKATHEIEPCEYKQPSRLLALSDIEGNLGAFRMLLLRNGVIDSNYNWIFKDGHLVLNGDIFDRGKQVTECLWLIYSLEEKAKKANGYVHFILGNHEIMNLSGDDRYIQQKYKENALKLNMPYSELYDRNSELGKWLRTKNVIEKIGNTLFTHAGISAEVNELSLSIRQVNEMVRPYYDNDSVAKASNNSSLKVLFDSKKSPFWYRLYYYDIFSVGDTAYKASPAQVNETLAKFGVDHIVTGHTIIADTVSVHYGNRVVNTDTKHAEGKSEALLIENDKYYRVNMLGNKILLFKDSFRTTAGKSTFLPAFSR